MGDAVAVDGGVDRPDGVQAQDRRIVQRAAQVPRGEGVQAVGDDQGTYAVIENGQVVDHHPSLP
jgi:hypothetical protein